MIQAIRIYSHDIGMEFGIEKCTMLIMKSWKRKTTKGIEQPNKERIRTLGEKENNKYLGILEADTIKQTEIKEKKRKKDNPRRTRKLLENKLCSRVQRNKQLGISSCKIFWVILKMEKGGSQSNGPKDKEIDSYTSERWQG